MSKALEDFRKLIAVDVVGKRLLMLVVDCRRECDGWHQSTDTVAVAAATSHLDQGRHLGAVSVVDVPLMGL